LDLYRLPESDDIWGQLGIGDTRLFRGFFVEWPERDTALSRQVTHRVIIEFAARSEARNFEFWRQKPQ
jgi:tRNA A37 threonylcarbamoyladenosine biosynthesis protein TsaE